ncbi:MAG: hypothetical protein J6R42_02320, partial [Clostridia bacterium]|nr:hypothetical protein [Clostridia bacterium]
TAYYRLVADLQMNANSADYKTWATFQPGTVSFVFNAPANNFTPIGKNATYRFKGVFDGNGHTISGLYVSAGGDMGLFGQIEGATVKNLTIKNSVFAATNKSNGAGAIAGVVYEGTFENCKIENVSVLNKGNAGGVAGTINKDTVYRNIIFSGEIVSSENHAGGIVGQGNYGANVLAIDVSVSGSVYAKNNAAGFVGIMNTNPRLVFADCQNDATVTSVSGIAAGIIGSCFYTTGGNALIEMKNVTNRGAVTGATYAGGIIGSTTSNSKTGYVTLHNILNSGAVKTTGADASAVGAGGIFGHVHARMFVKMDNCVSLGTVEGVNAGSVIGLFALAEDNSVAQNVYGLGQTVGSAPELVVEQGKFLQLTDEQANGTDASVLNALNGAVTDENGYKTWSLADGKLAF